MFIAREAAARAYRRDTRRCSDLLLTVARFDKIQTLIASERKGNVIYQKKSSHSQKEVEQSLREAAQRHKFGILHILDLKKTLHDKGIDLESEVRISLLSKTAFSVNPGC